MIPEATLNYWADVFVSRKLHEQGLRLDQFLHNPRAMLERMDKLAAAAKCPHHNVPPMRELRQLNRVRQRGPVAIQKLWHGSRQHNRANMPLPGKR